MEVAIAGSGSGGSPFQREVREWQRIDPNTGALLTGRLEADRWINGSLNSYGKVVDSQNVSQPNGTQHSQRKQLEVLQARTSSGSMQVIRAHTVQTTSSRWTATSSSSASSSNSSSPLMTSLNAGAGANLSHSHHLGGFFGNHSQRFQGNLSLTNESGDSVTNNGIATDDDSYHLNHHPKGQQHHVFTATPSLKLSNLMKSTPTVTNGTSGSQNKAVLRKTNNVSPSSATSPRPQQRQRQQQHQFFRQQETESMAALDQRTSSSSSMSSTSTTAATTTSSHGPRRTTTTSSGLFRYDSSRYDLPTTESHVGGNSGGKIIDICSRDIDDVGDDDNDDDRVNSSASRRRQEATWQSSTAPLQRGRSISTDDLTSNGNTSTHANGSGGDSGGGVGGGGDENDDEPAEWRRVSKIRRSFQFPSTTAPESSKPASSSVFRPRPVDLPERSVSVSKIRAELENGRRLSTAMRNNHVDLVALDTILNGGSGPGSGAVSPLTTKKKTASFLTAESLKEIRGKLKKLSDESLYKDDFVTKKDEEPEETREAATSSPVTAFQYSPRPNGTLHTTNSLESRNIKYKDTSSAEWHLRRKSYGFEKMSPPSDKSMFRFENSTDSGLGRSSDLGNWSPTTDAVSPSTKSTVITFGEQAASESRSRPMVQRRLRNRTQPQSEAESAEMKRHSIAVDESQYVRENLRKTSAVHLNGFYSKDTSPQNSGFSDDNSRRQKRVEFCKTEVHFAAESGRVNIVETDGKPPPSNNFRRRRRSSSSSSTTTSSISSSSTLDPTKAGLPVIHFGDERKAIFDENLDADEDPGDDKSPMSNVTVSIPISLEKNFDSESRDGDDHQDEISIRGILKNKPIKPKPYHLGENIDSADALWGVQLKPVGPRSFSGERDQTEEDFKEATVPSKSVAERIRIVEERKEGAGYSTKINLNLSNSPYEWTDTGAPRSSYDDQLKHDFYGLSPFAKLSPPLTDDGLKSTPLIIKTLRSANQFDEAMRRLSMSSNTSSGAETQTASVTTKHVSSLSHIAKAVSTSVSSSSYSSSLNDDFRTSRSSRPIAAPRLKVVGSTTNSITHQLSQLRRMYEHAGLDSDDSARADEEVKGYFGGDLDDDDDEDVCGYEASELSGSWSRVKAKRTVLKTQKVNQEVPQSNILNIELHSPMATAIKKPESIRMQPPVAKPRTITAVKQTTIQKEPEDNPSQSKSSVTPANSETTEHLKIVRETRGARKLREHELSYFGVKVTSADITDARSTVTTSKPKITTISKRSLPSRKLPTAAKDEGRSTTQWSLPNDKPDLLRHSPIVVEPQIVTKTAIVAPSIGVQRLRSRSPADSSDDQTDGIYENIKPPGTYCRQTDLERDEMILSEMTRTADQTLKAVSDEAAQKDLRRRSISRRSSKPLETIDEKFTKPISKTASRPRTTTHRIVRECSNRPSSASSCDSLPPTPTKQRSRSRSRENEYVNLKPKTSSRCLKYRSSSRESQKSGNSSTEDTAHKIEIIRKPKRSATKDEPHMVRHHHSQQQRSLRSSTESHDRHKVTPRSSTRDRVESHDPQQSRTHRSSHAATKSDAEHKRSSHTSTVDSKCSTKTSRSRAENDKPSSSSVDRMSKSKAHSSQSQSERHHSRQHRSTGSKSATMSSSGNNSDTLIHGKNSSKHRSSSATASSSSKITSKSSSKDRK